jgi:dephospho-CoA kinase
MTSPPSPRPLVVGLTGSIGMGKSTVAGMLREEGVPVFDADAAVHVLQGPGGALLAAIEDRFPGSTGPGGVDRAVLGARVFEDPVALADLELIVHPAVARAQRAFLDAHADAPFVVLDIPLLFEKGGAALVDRVVVVSAPAAIQRARVLGRPQMSEEKFSEILALQTPDAEKRQRADYVIDTGAPLGETRRAIAALVDTLRDLSSARDGAI